MQQRVVNGTAVVLLAISIAACGASRTFQKGETLAKQGDWDAAVGFYTKAVQEDPDRPEYKIALERAMQAAANSHMEKARAFEAKGDLENAILEYRRAAEFAPGNSLAAQRRTDLERQLREKAEAERKPSRIDTMRERARRQAETPVLNPTSRDPLGFRFVQTPVQDILKVIADNTGINIIVEQGANSVVSRPMTFTMEGLTLEQSLNLIMTQNQLWYKVMNERTILVIQDTPQKRQQYEEQIIRTFYISHADTQEMFNLLNQVMRITGVPIQPFVSANKTTNTITVRGTPNVVNILEKVIQANDRPRAEVVIDVEILEVNRARVKELGLNLSQYSIGAIFSPETAPGGATDEDGVQVGDRTGQFNLNTISQGISTADFYLTVPSAVVKFLASDTNTRLLAKPQLRGAEGADLELNLGDEVPVPSTTFGGVAAGGVQTVPISSFNYRTVGIVVKMTPRVTFDNEIVLNIEVENSTQGNPQVVAGQALPTFGTRKVKTRMRLREGESNLLAGLVREQDRRILTGFPGLLRVPILKDIFGSTEDRIEATDIVILMTPRIVRTHELTQENLNPIYIGSQINLGLTGPAPVIGGPPEPEPAPAQPPAAAPPPQGAVPPPVGPGIPPASPTPRASPTPTTTPGLSPVPPPQPQPQPAQPAQTPPETPLQTPPEQPPPATAQPATPPPATPEPAAQIVISTPGPELRVGGGPYLIPVSVTGASRLSLTSLSVTFNGAVLRVRSVQEGPFLRQGGATTSFANQIDPGGGRVDLSITRNNDVTGASGTGLLATLAVDAVAAGTSSLTVSGVATTPDGRGVSLTFTPTSVTVK